MLKQRLELADERGTTLAELVVGMAVGMIVLMALTMVMIVSMHASARVSARVHATQNARISLAKVIAQLHSACVVPKVAPIQAGSTATTLNFSHAPASEGTSATAQPVRSEISLSGTKLLQTDYASLGTTPPSFSETASGPSQVLATNIVPTPPSTSIFRYYSYLKGKLVQIPQAKLGLIEANSVIQVKVAFTGLPTTTTTTSSSDTSVGASVENSAMLRLTPPSFRDEAGSPPCQ